MEQGIRECLSQGGIQVDEILERLGGSEALVERFLKRFLQDTNFQALCQAMESGSMEQALAASHTLKGMCGNLSMNELTNQFTQQVAQLRAGDYAAAAQMMPQIQSDYQRVVQAIQRCWP